jgi:hypothetical protein
MLTNEHDFSAWLREAPAGDTRIYHRGGSLGDARTKDKAIEELATAALAASDRNDVLLIQRRLDPPGPHSRFEYIAVRKASGRLEPSRVLSAHDADRTRRQALLAAE